MNGRPNREFDVIVVGAGILGVFHAYFAAKNGLRVLLLERDDTPRGASVRNFGWCIPSAMAPGEWAERGIASLEVYRELAAAVGFPFSQNGTLYVASTELEEAVIREFVESNSHHGLHREFLDDRRTREMNPFVRPDYGRASLYFPDEIRIEPRTILGDLLTWLGREFDCEYRPRTVASRAEASAGQCRVISTEGLVFTANHVFVCSGADVRTLFPEILAAAGVRRCKLQMFRTVPQQGWQLPTNLASGLSIRRYPSFQNCPSWAKLSQQAAEPGYDERGIHVLLVQDYEGRLVVGDSHVYSHDDMDDMLDAETESLILRYAQQMVDGVDWRIDSRWQGEYSLLEDREILETTIDGRIHLVTGIGGKGMTTAPAVARESIERHWTIR
ncbi:N-methyltryptophan oxidase [Symmachiella macrocystis]|uniref:N-methyltryptophan oxidase n=1 Tax=Symmachiella macrocystis TaxID=2527985 RepID=A0A5C6BBZ0_9PLAN|nr:TIGR03364 family FAD-dependent oxidoreductase [Symmachiella macrocystis]TWU09177.1 N-methyltryptophan oxidase [Symmachiella macrocystis]